MENQNVIIEKVEGESWIVVKTNSRCEKKFAAYCERRRLNYYLPLRRSVRQYRRRKVEFWVPLFKGYVFTQIDPRKQAPLIEFQHAARIIVPDPPMEETLIQELNDIQTLLAATLTGEIMVRPEIQVGTPVQIQSGALSGLRGIVTRRQNKTRLTINVEMVGYAVSIDVDADEVELDV